jgi:hypothetical protein
MTCNKWSCLSSSHRPDYTDKRTVTDSKSVRAESTFAEKGGNPEDDRHGLKGRGNYKNHTAYITEKLPSIFEYSYNKSTGTGYLGRVDKREVQENNSLPL